ncbi:peptide chain release factor N(5)-glutamine methyltransferase [Phycicoccus sp. HDW14]|uniref:peptide chain release factor N(5)-glutamine methyltransferase n=1 Tax=Phycicoccus sp. HDW14 TaxID=2714941 RepID=UPI001407F711|nr:peptide chain release factor N(5)-glutamine methyltransferase [Phycicoccus sp. HDW14]QIM20294.1 peptide chain release factor N(5)-glutamine methyltransferase [Phycicoccus sp. HDW14]
MTASPATLHDAVTRARLSFEDEGIASPEADAVELAAFALGTDAADVRRRMVMRAPTDAGFLDTYAGLVEERLGRVPLQHLTGRAYFRRLTLAVGPGVFVPRPETEVTAGLALEAALAAGAAPLVVDLCTGSGAIALAVKDELPAATVHAVELSDLAHGWAVANRDRLGLDVEVLLGDATTAFPELEGVVDVVVSNPPYIPDGARPLDPEVRDHDPEVALYGRSADGLGVPLAVAARAAVLLRDGGVLVMEHADTQGETLPAHLRTTGDWVEVLDHRDLTGRPRATVAVRAPR